MNSLFSTYNRAVLDPILADLDRIVGNISLDSKPGRTNF